MEAAVVAAGEVVAAAVAGVVVAAAAAGDVGVGSMANSEPCSAWPAGGVVGPWWWSMPALLGAGECWEPALERPCTPDTKVLGTGADWVAMGAEQKIGSRLGRSRLSTCSSADCTGCIEASR